jgi:hypothetical protein
MTVKLCKDCKWVENPGRFAQCTYPAYFNPGSNRWQPSKHGVTYCDILRSGSWIASLFHSDGCNKRGRFFEPKYLDVEYSNVYEIQKPKEITREKPEEVSTR